MSPTTAQPLPEVQWFEWVVVYFVAPRGLTCSSFHARDVSHQQERMCSLIPCPQTHPNTQLEVISYQQKKINKKTGRERQATTQFAGSGLNGPIKGLEEVTRVAHLS